MSRASNAAIQTHAFLSDLWNHRKRDGAWSDEELNTFEFKFDAFHIGERMEVTLAGLTGEPVSVTSYCPSIRKRHKRFVKKWAEEDRQLHLVWSSEPTELISPSWFFAMAEGYAVCGFGVFRFDKKQIIAYHALVDTRGDELDAALEASGGDLSDYGTAPSKRVPKPYAAEHPREALLRRKSLVVVQDMAKALRSDNMEPLEAVTDAFTRFLPLYNFLRENLPKQGL